MTSSSTDAAAVAIAIDSNSAAISSAATMAASAAASVSATVASSSATVIQAINSSSLSKVDPTATAISSAVVSDLTTLSNEVADVASAMSVTAKDLYKSPLSTILTICGRSLLKETQMTSANILLVAHDVMESIESLKTLQIMENITSDQKKQLAVDCLHWLVNNHDDLSPDDKEAVNLLIDTVVPNTIDIMIAVSNGESELVTAVSKCSCVIV